VLFIYHRKGDPLNHDQARTTTAAYILCIALLLTLIPVIYNATTALPALSRILLAIFLLLLFAVAGILLCRQIYTRAYGQKPRGKRLLAVLGAAVLAFLISFALTAVLTLILVFGIGITANEQSVLSVDLIAGTILNAVLFPLVFCMPMAVIRSDAAKMRFFPALAALLKAKYLVLLIASVLCGVGGMLIDAYATSVLATICSLLFSIVLLLFSTEQTLKEIKEAAQ
jgi:hypothetical protein